MDVETAYLNAPLQEEILRVSLFSIPTTDSALNAPCMDLNNLLVLGTMIYINH